MASPEARFGHVHGLGLNPGDDTVYAATHYGVFRLGPDGPQRVADRYQDTMGFTVTGPDEFLGSGHPDPREDGPPHLGLIASTDRAESWEEVSLRGEADFHALSAVGGTVYGWDSTTGSVLRSDDAGVSWERGATVAVADLDVDPSDPRKVLATTEQGLVQSRDAGTTFEPSTEQPPQPLVYLDHVTGLDTGTGEVAGVDATGRVWRTSDAGWAEVGSLPGAPEAFTVAADGTYLAATAEGVYVSDSAGGSWNPLASSEGG